MSWLSRTADASTPFARVFGLRPDLFAAYREFHAQFWELGLVDPVLLELCRLRVAGLLGCRAELAIRYRPAIEAGLEEARVAAIRDWPRSDAFDATERAVLAMTDGFVLDPHGLSDETVGAVVERLGEATTVALAEALAIFDGFARFRSLLGIEPEAASESGPRVVDPPSREHRDAH